MTYKQAYDKIIDAYFKDEIQPYKYSFCFCGTIGINSDKARREGGNWDFRLYTVDQYKEMESALLTTIRNLTIGESSCNDIFLSFPFSRIRLRENVLNHSNYEAALFAGMCAALEVLKQIHIDRGEEIDPLPTFTKRVFSDVLKMVK